MECFLAATGGEGDPHRKPGTFMWQIFNKRLNEETELDKEASFYCGDLAGRLAVEQRPADASSTDLYFAKNIGLKFHTPESMFLGEVLDLPASSQDSSDSDAEPYASPDDSKAAVAEDDSDSPKISTAAQSR